MCAGRRAGRLLGVGRLPCLDTLWGWFYGVAKQRRAEALLEEFFLLIPLPITLPDAALGVECEDEIRDAL
jgi:hypothetical protein